MEFQTLIQKAQVLRDEFALQEARRGKRWGLTEHFQGFVGDVGDLGKLIMAQQGLRPGSDIDKRLVHELADCLWSILIIADELHIDLEQGFLATMEDLRASAKDAREHSL